MISLWEHAPQTITQLVAALRTSTGWAKSTVITLLGRMTEKQAVRFEEGGRAKLYYPAVTREELAPQENETFLKRLYGGSLSMMLNTMVESNALTPEELQEMRNILERADQTDG